MTTEQAPGIPPAAFMFSEQERAVLEQESARKGWHLRLRGSGREVELARFVGGGSMTQPEYTVDIDVERGGERISATIHDHDGDRARYTARRIVEGLPERD